MNPNLEDAKEIGKRIKILRQEKSLSQNQFAQIIGTDQDTVSSWETGKNLVSLRFILRICREFDYKINDFTKI